MADVFLSYARPSAAAAERIAAALRDDGYSVWLDQDLPAHRAYADVIAAELDAAGAVLVLWSDAATRSQWVRSEANRAREKGNLVQVRLDAAPLPMPFDQLQCADLQGWNGVTADSQWRPAAAALDALILGQPTDARAAPSASKPSSIEQSVAILPLRELGAATGDYLGEGLAEEILTMLARLPGLRVAAGLSPRTNLSAADVAAGLRTDTYLEGSIRKSGDKARISVRLADTATGFVRWSETFDRTLSDVFAVQEEIARAVAAALGIALLDRDARSVSNSASVDAKANELALQARHLARQELEVERRAAADLFRHAIGRDPKFALAHAGLADVLVQIARWRLADWREAAAEALTAARQAVELAPDMADAQLALGAALALARDPTAHDAYARAVALDPQDANIHYRMARFLVLSGDKAGAVRHYERAFQLAPDDYRYIVYALQEYQALGDADGERSCLVRSAAAIERHLDIYPSDVRALGHGAGVMALLGRGDKAQQMIDRAAAMRPADYGNLVTLACAAMLNADADQALDLLERAVATGQGDRDWIMQDNDLKPLHGHPRFEELVGRMVT